MPKRKLVLPEFSSKPTKRVKQSHDNFSCLSDELLLRIFLHLPIETVAVCHRVSRRLNRIAGDSQVWRPAYYSRFIMPRLPTKRSLAVTRTAHTSPSWLDERVLLNADTDWKRQYKVRHNWSQGACNIIELPIASLSPPPLLARLHAGVVITVDRMSGVRAWAYKSQQELLASYDLEHGAGRPLCMTLDTDTRIDADLRIAIGLDDGEVQVYSFNRSSNTIHLDYRKLATDQDSTVAIAVVSSYMVTLAKSSLLSIYKLPVSSGMAIQVPYHLTSVRSTSICSPLSLGMRVRADAVITTIAYLLPGLHTGWSVGVQELSFSHTGETLESRLASSSFEGFRSLINQGTRSSTTHASALSPQQSSRPTSVSYSHPYLLATHRDNTMTLFMVTSTKDALTITSGRQLWGHTSSISDVQIGGRGKAVSVTRQGREIRVWELERATPAKRRVSEYANTQLSISVTPRPHSTEANILWPSLSKTLQMSERKCGPIARERPGEDVARRSWVGFDEENVVVMMEQATGSHALTIYDFT